MGNALAAGTCADAGDVKSSDRQNTNKVLVAVIANRTVRAVFNIGVSARVNATTGAFVKTRVWVKIDLKTDLLTRTIALENVLQ